MLKIRGFKVQKTTNHKGLNPKHGVMFVVPFKKQKKQIVS